MSRCTVRLGPLTRLVFGIGEPYTFRALCVDHAEAVLVTITEPRRAADLMASLADGAMPVWLIDDADIQPLTEEGARP